MVILNYWREKEREEKREKVDKNKCLYTAKGLKKSLI